MGNIRGRVQVELAERSYQITIGYDIWSGCVKQLRSLAGGSKAYIISDENVYGLYGHKLEIILAEAGFAAERFVVLPGENSKSWEQAGQILEEMLTKNLERKTAVLALGGGVVGDLAGFVAALYRRGTPFIQIPTTLLAQVDSSVGGKVAVNHPRGKNMFGTFYQPAAVWADLATLDTLSPQEWAAGLAEVAKYAVIKSRELFQLLEDRAREILARDRRYLPQVIEECCRIKAEIVRLDERDEGLRNILNFGHTFGHALESATRYRKYRHGEAVAVGMAAVMELAVQLGLCSMEERDRVVRLLESWQLPVYLPSNLVEDVLLNLHYDKKVADNLVTFILPLAIGQVRMQSGIPVEELRRALLKRSK